MGLPLLEKRQKRRGGAREGEGDGPGLLPCRENLLPSTAAGAQRSAPPPPAAPSFPSSGHRQRRLPHCRSRRRARIPAPVLPYIKFRPYALRRGGWGGGFTPKKVGGGGIRDAIINKETFRWADLLRCHVNKREGAFLAVILTLHILYTIHKYT